MGRAEKRKKSSYPASIGFSPWWRDRESGRNDRHDVVSGGFTGSILENYASASSSSPGFSLAWRSMLASLFLLCTRTVAAGGGDRLSSFSPTAGDARRKICTVRSRCGLVMTRDRMPAKAQTKHDTGFPRVRLVSMMNCPHRPRSTTKGLQRESLLVLIAAAGTLVSFFGVAGWAQGSSLPQREAITVEGTVRNPAGDLLAGALLRLEEKEHSNFFETKTQADGSFVFSGMRPGIYTVRAEKSGWREGVSNPLVLNAGDKKRVDLVLESLAADHPGSSGASTSFGSVAGAMEFDDKPNFTVAGVTDWNNMGMHGSDVNVRTSEALVKETLTLKNGGLVEKPAVDRKSKETSLNSGESEKRLRAAREEARKMQANADTADTHRLLGELNERLGDPLEAVREYERAARMDPSEQNYFEWGTELLLHRANEPAVQVFTKGSNAHPDSARMLAGLGAALYAGGSYNDAARRLCEASDLKPADPTPYVFLGKMEKAGPGLPSCGEHKLARFVRDQPGDALANYYY